jgi:hypothetical protein
MPLEEMLTMFTNMEPTCDHNASEVHSNGELDPNEEKSIHANTTPVSKVVTNPNFVRACSWMVVVVVEGHFTHEPRAVTMRL